MTDAPCKDCTERSAGCHASCGRYRDWTELHKAERDQRYNAKLGDLIANSYAINTIRKIKKEQRRRRR